ncbi:MAG: hypothetical protein ABSA76_00975 [Bacteroidales bacterium]
MLSIIVKNWHLILSILLGIYEAIVRLIPTIPVKYSIVKIIFDLLKWISDNLNISKK